MRIADLVRYLSDLRWRVIYDSYRKKYPGIDSQFSFNGPGIEFYGDGDIVCGRGSYIGKYSTVQAVKGRVVTVGINSAISHYVRIYTMNRDPDQDMSKTPQQMKSGNVAIGDFCWIGVGTLINAGIRVGDNSVVGANSVVTKDIPPHCIAHGNPAKVSRFKSYIGDEGVNKLVLSYWDSLSDELKLGRLKDEQT